MGANQLSENMEATTAEKVTLKAYRQHLSRYGAPPPYRKLAKVVGLSPTSVQYHLKRLSEKGFLEKQTFSYEGLGVSERGKRVKL
jgi:DNA-binding MarR family transcriptional regulator